MKFDAAYFLEILPMIAQKLDITLSLTLISAVFSLLIGIVLALVGYYKIPVLSQIVKIWISFMRGTPGLTQLFFFYYGLARISELILNMPPVVAVAVVMSLNMGAFMSESIRAAMLSVDKGQHEAAASLGMNSLQTMTRIMLPQAVRVALPPLFNDLINLFKMSSLAYLIGLRDVMGAAKIEAASSFKFFECYAAVMLIYWIVTMLMTVVQKRLEIRCNAAY